MSDPRQAVLSALAAHSDADGETTTVAVVAAAAGVSQTVADRELEGLVAADLARMTDGAVRVTVTAEQLLALDVEGPVVIDPD